MLRAALFLLCGLRLAAQPSAVELLEKKTAAELRRFEAGFDGALGVAAIDLTSGSVIALNPDTLFPQASVIKIPILISVYQAQKDGRLRLADRVTVAAKDLVDGSVALAPRLQRGETAFTVRELVDAMMHVSDNTATNRIIDLLGMAYVNQTAASLGAKRTRLQRRMMDSAAALRNDENIGSPIEMARLMEAIYRGRAVDKASSEEMLGIMRGLRAGISEGVPLDTEIAAKDGQLPGARCETGVVLLRGRPFVLSVMSAFLDDRRSPVPEVTRILYRHFERLAASNRYGNRLR
jgi:beta-lactamase class A